MQVGDPQEANAIADVFCKDRNTPLLVGSVKSNMGHSEPASGLCSVAKVLIAMESGVIPPNLHYQDPNPDIPALSDGSLQVSCVKHNKVEIQVSNFSGHYLSNRSTLDIGVWCCIGIF